jgi:signal transduction histidine kinase
MKARAGAPDDADETPPAGIDVLRRLQVAANEQLLLSALRADDEMEQALESQHRAELEAEALKLREQQLQSTAEFRERMIGIIGHDLRTPLSSINLSAGRLLSQGRLNEVDSRLAARIVRSGLRIDRMIGQLVDFTRARLGGGFALRRTSTDLAQVCGDVIEELRIASSVEIELTLQGDVRGSWDGDRLEEVISNLAGNATDYATPGTVVTVAVVGAAEVVEVSVSNQGPAIPADVLPEIFMAFHRAHSDASARSGHLGLGLYIAHEIIRAHGGTLEARSSGGTTTFTARLPRVPPP